MQSEYLILVNKNNTLPSNYIPKDLIKVNVPFDDIEISEKHFLRHAAAKNLEQLFKIAYKNHIFLTAVSGYRSYFRQKEIYDQSLLKNGKLYTKKYIGKPGQSEHQTGLAIDLSTPSINNVLEDNLIDTAEGIWLNNHSYNFGFIIRYPLGKESITGYNYEPWHFRFVGLYAAKKIYKRKITLEEYLNLIT